MLHITCRDVILQSTSSLLTTLSWILGTWYAFLIYLCPVPFSLIDFVFTNLVSFNPKPPTVNILQSLGIQLFFQTFHIAECDASSIIHFGMSHDSIVWFYVWDLFTNPVSNMYNIPGSIHFGWVTTNGSNPEL